jgi:Glycosyl transferases group 1
MRSTMQPQTGELMRAIRPYLKRQKLNLIYRVRNPIKYCLDVGRVRLASTPNQSSGGLIRVALISDLDAPSSEQQFYPFSTYRSRLREELHLASAHLMLKDALRFPRIILSCFDIVILKLSYRTDADEALRIARSFRQAVGSKAFVYFDGDDDICVQWPKILPYVDLYVKKHGFRDRTQYLRTFIGKSNLHDYAYRKHGHVLTSRDYGNPGDKKVMITESGPVPRILIDKIKIGIDLATDSVISELYERVKKTVIKDEDKERRRDIDIIFRGSVTKGTIVYPLRSGIAPILRQLEHKFRVIIPTEPVPRDDYYEEMMRSRICISPFGYGEICWRDYEAILCRCLLIKPNMDHVETNPDIFQAYKTYIPVEWDFSDLREKCEYYLNNENESAKIASEAYKVLDEFYKSAGFIRTASSFVDLLRRSEKLARISSR